MNRRFLGESLNTRLNERVFRRPKIGFTPSFYARWGMEDPWLSSRVLSLALGAGLDWTFLSDHDYQSHRRRLGFERWSRAERVQNEISARFDSWNALNRGKTASSYRFSGLDFDFLEAQQTPHQEDELEVVPQVRERTRPMVPVASPWGQRQTKNSASDLRYDFEKGHTAPYIESDEQDSAGKWIERMAPPSRM